MRQIEGRSDLLSPNVKQTLFHEHFALSDNLRYLPKFLFKIVKKFYRLTLTVERKLTVEQQRKSQSLRSLL